MKMKLVILLSAILLISSAYANLPRFQNMGTLEFTNGNVLLAPVQYGHTVPVFTDWNGDGNVDLITGQFDFGYVFFCPNSGTNENPQFNEEDLVHMMADGAPITCSYG